MAETIIICIMRHVLTIFWHIFRFTAPIYEHEGPQLAMMALIFSLLNFPWVYIAHFCLTTHLRHFGRFLL